MCQFESKNSAKLTSIAQNLVNLASRGRYPLAKSISTGKLYIKIFCIVTQDCPCTDTFNYYAIPPGFIIDVPTIFAWDTDDSTEETRSGKRTAHITGGIIIQREQSIATELRR